MRYMMVKYFQKKVFHVQNQNGSFTRHSITKADGIIQIADVDYGSKYPNGSLDIYLMPKERRGTSPTLIFVHGGGFCWGDKTGLDPTAGKFDLDLLLKVNCRQVVYLFTL